MKTLLRLIMEFEGCKLRAYLCPAGVWTIGWGATGPGIFKGLVWTQEQADARMALDAAKYWKIAGRESPILFQYPEIHEAIADFCFNLGGTKYRSSTLKKRVDEGDWEGACQQIMRWVHGGGRRLPGLVRRREAERQIIASASGMMTVTSTLSAEQISENLVWDGRIKSFLDGVRSSRQDRFA